VWAVFVMLSSFLQAEDGIRSATVTGVQTSALPIFPIRHHSDSNLGRLCPIRHASELSFLSRIGHHDLGIYDLLLGGPNSGALLLGVCESYSGSQSDSEWSLSSCTASRVCK